MDGGRIDALSVPAEIWFIMRSLKNEHNAMMTVMTGIQRWPMVVKVIIILTNSIFSMQRMQHI